MKDNYIYTEVDIMFILGIAIGVLGTLIVSFVLVFIEELGTKKLNKEVCEAYQNGYDTGRDDQKNNYGIEKEA